MTNKKECTTLIAQTFQYFFTLLDVTMKTQLNAFTLQFFVRLLSLYLSQNNKVTKRGRLISKEAKRLHRCGICKDLLAFLSPFWSN